MVGPSDLAVLQAVRLKGRAPTEAVAAAAGVSADEAGRVLDGLASAGDVEPTPAGAKLTPAGRARLDELLAAERAHLDGGALDAVYERFCGLNDEFKQLVTSWQLTPDGTLNDHADAAYDAAVFERLYDLHDRFGPVVDDAVAAVPRLAPYRRRFDEAVGQVRAGRSEYLARPLVDSYHTVWFEFHEELILASGRDRATEAAAGRAT